MRDYQAHMAVVIGALMLSACGSGGNAEAASASSAAQHATEEPSAESTTTSSVQALGGITARLNGAGRTWYVTAERAGDGWISQSDATAAGSVNLFGHATAETRTSDKDALIINAMVREIGPDLEVSGVEITFIQGGFGSGSYSTANDGEALVRVSNMVSDDGLTHIMGTFSGTLPYKKYSNREAEPGNVVTIEGGRFNAKLPPLRR